MRLTSTQVKQTLSQFDAQAIPDNHPVIPRLNDLFGDHTFFVDANGLNIVEPSGPAVEGLSAQVVNIASWSDPDMDRLAPHEPELVDVFVVIGPGEGEMSH